MRQLHALGFAVLGIDYRGFGRSSDALPSETLVAEDTRAAWDWLAVKAMLEVMARLAIKALRRIIGFPSGHGRQGKATRRSGFGPLRRGR